MQTRHPFLCFCCMLAIIGSSFAQASSKPIIAVFDLEDKGAGLSAEMINRLTEYLASSLAATGVYQVVPRSSIKERLSTQKKETYQHCYDQTCQIDIGKELAAQKSLSPQVIKLGSKCMVTAVLYDLRRAASEGGGRAEGGCAEDEIVKSLQSLINELVPRAPTQPRPSAVGLAGSASTPIATSSAPGPQVTIDVHSTPPAAEVFLDGRSAGFTPLRVELVKGRHVTVSIEKIGYLNQQQALLVEDRRTLEFSLPLTDDGRRRMADRTEWFSVAPWGGVTGQGGAAFGGSLRLFTLKWGLFHWTILDAGAGGGDAVLVHGGTFPSLAFRYGSAAQHQLRIGLSLGVVAHDERYSSYNTKTQMTNYSGASGVGFGILPTVGYYYQTAGRFFVGVELRCAIPLTGYIKQSDPLTDPQDNFSYPVFCGISVPLGLASALD
jgi:hypothetical protein